MAVLLRLVIIVLLIALGRAILLVPSISDNMFLDLPFHLALFVLVGLPLFLWLDDSYHGVPFRRPLRRR